MRTSIQLAAGLFIGLALSAGATLLAQIPGRNVNMVAGTGWPEGDPFLQRQNEPTMAASTRNPMHLLGGSNDYRTVDLPFGTDQETGDAWISVYKSFDGGQRWSSTLLPGYPQDTSEAGMASPLKGYQAGADPVVRAGTHGLLYYSGLVFDRAEGGKSGIFLTRFIDTNSKENGDPVSYLGTTMVTTSTGAQFLDKPWMAVDIPRGNNPVMCVVGGTPDGAKVKRNGHKNGRGNSTNVQDDGLIRVPGGAVYVAYTSITGDGDTLRAEIFLKRSLDCGTTWSAPIRVTNTADAINQGAVIAIDPVDGDVFVAWRRFASPSAPAADAVMLARLPAGGGTFSLPGKARAFAGTGSPSAALEKIFEHRKKRAQPTVVGAVSNPDQGTSSYSFRTNAYPAMAIDGSSRVYIAWAERGFAIVPRESSVDGDARVLVATTTDAASFTTPVIAANETLGHQVMPSLAFAGGKLMLVYYDLRDTAAQLFEKYISDQNVTIKRQTIDIRASLGTTGPTPVFAPSVKVSDYLMGFRNNSSLLEQLQINPPNLPMFKLGTVPFIGDYIDVSPSPAFVPAAGGKWVYNTSASATFPLFHATWTDNRDVRAPIDGNWAHYTPPTIIGSDGRSVLDPSQLVEVCHAGNAGSRNQNVYTARIGGGLLVGAPGNSKQLSTTLQRGFAVYATNETTTTKTFRMTVLGQPVGGRASFEQFPLPPYTATSPPPKIVLDLNVPGRSTASRTLYVTSSDPKAQVFVDVTQVASVGGPPVTGGLAGRVVINPDIDNPDIDNPDIDNPDIDNPDIDNAEVYNPDIDNPDIDNPDIDNPDIDNPDIDNPDLDNVRVANPDIDNTGVGNPDIDNPDIDNPDIDNGGIENPDIDNGTISDVTWEVSNIGNTTAAFNVNVFLAGAADLTGLVTQLVLYKTYKTPVLDINGCDLRTETRNVLMFNVNNPTFITSGAVPDQNDPSEKNATIWLAPGELGRVTLRVYDYDKSNNIIVTNLDGSHASIDPRFNPSTAVTLGVSGQGVDVLDPPGTTEPPVVTTTGTNLFFIQQPTSAEVGAVITPAVQVRLFDNTGLPLPAGVTVNVSLLNPPAGVVLSGTLNALTVAGGVATFANLVVNAPASGLRLRATATAPGVVAGGTSEPFDVGIAPPTNLFFIVQPTATAVGAGIAPAVQVRVQDDSGAVIPGVFVNMSLLAPPPGVVLGGTVNAVASVDGIATFANLTVNAAASGLRLRATATFPGGSETGTSDPFNVGTPATVTITNHTFIYDGDPHAVPVTTDPPGLSVAVTYNGSATVPSAIGAYFALATVNSPTHFGSGSVILKIATTLAAGGPGGNPYGLLSCSPGVFANGIRPSTNSFYGLLGAQLLCSNSINPARFSGPFEGAYTDTPVSCGAGEVMVGVHGHAGAPFDFRVIERIGAQCMPIGGVEATFVPEAGGGLYPDADMPFSLTCPAGQAVTGIVGGVGEVVDSIALVCAPTAPTIASASPSSVAEFQYVTLSGANLPASAATDVLFSQGGPEIQSDYLWTASANLVVARVPPGLVVDGPATTVRLKNTAGTVTTNSLPITIAGTPSAPVLRTIYSSTVSGVPTTTLIWGQEFLVEADGVHSANTTFHWVQGGTDLAFGWNSVQAGPTGRVGTAGTVPPLTPGVWSLRVTTTIAPETSPQSNGILVTVVSSP